MFIRKLWGSTFRRKDPSASLQFPLQGVSVDDFPFKRRVHIRSLMFQMPVTAGLIGWLSKCFLDFILHRVPVLVFALEPIVLFARCKRMDMDLRTFFSMNK